jgi:hypothetical protein
VSAAQGPRSLPGSTYSQRRPGEPLSPLALKMCAGCTAQYAVEGDVGDEQGGSPWFGPCCPVPPRYADVFIRDASMRMEGRDG